MNELIQTGFDYGDLPAEKVLECETAFQTACAIENQAVVMIGEQFAKVKANLKFLRNGNGWYEWCDKRLGKSVQTAENYINASQNRESIKNFDTFGKSALFLLVAPNTPQEVRDRADALAEAGEDVSVKTIKKLKADVEAERQARAFAEQQLSVEIQRGGEWKEESNERRKTIRDLETQIGFLKAQPAPKPEKITVAPADYETVKAEAAKLRQRLADIEARKDQLVQQQVVAKLKEREQEIETLNRRAEQLKGTITEYQAHLAKVHLPELEMQQQLKAVEDFMRACAGLAASLALFEHTPNPATASVWQKGIAAATDAAQAMRMHVDRRPELTVIQGGAA